MPSVAVLIPTYNEEKNIAKVVEGLIYNNRKLEGLEILIIDGGSRDNTLEIVYALSFKYPGMVRLIKNPRRTQAAALNIGVEQAKAEIIIRCDAHASYEPGYIKACLAVFKETGADVVGGAQRAIGETYFQQVVAIAYNSCLGSGWAKYRNPDYSGFVDTVWMGGYRRDVFAAGLRFDESIPRDEDYEFFLRLRSRGKKIYLSSKVQAYYLPRDSLLKLAGQFFVNGSDVSRTIKKIRQRLMGRPLIILSGIVFLLILSMAACFSPVALRFLELSLLVYGGALILQTLLYVGKQPLRQLCLVPVVLFSMHFSYAAGLFLGCIRECITGILRLGPMSKKYNYYKAG